MTYKITSNSVRGRFRDLSILGHIHGRSKEAIVFVNAFIENEYWFDVNLPDRSIAKYYSSKGYDVHILNFPVKLGQNHLYCEGDDLSFQEIVGQHLPFFHKSILDQYDHIHFAGHSFGQTLVMSYLMGLVPDGTGAFIPSKIVAKISQQKVRSVISISGLYAVHWPNEGKRGDEHLYEGAPFRNKSLDFLIKEVDIKKVQQLNPVINSHLLKVLKWVPHNTKVLSMAGPIVGERGPFSMMYWPNVDEPSFNFAMDKGVNAESIEVIRTALGLYVDNDVKEGTKTMALKNYHEALKDFEIPIVFIQGDRDQITHPKGIREYGYDLVGSKEKEWLMLKDQGHQDIFLAKDLSVFYNHLDTWLKNWSKNLPAVRYA